MGFDVKELKCKSCGAPLQVDRKLSVGMVIVCKYCGTTHIVTRNDVESVDDHAAGHREAQKNHCHFHYHEHNHYHARNRYAHDEDATNGGGPIPHQVWEEQECERVRESRRRQQAFRHKLGGLATKALLVLIMVTFVLMMAQADAGDAAVYKLLLCVEAVGLVAVLCGALELKEKSMELALDEVRAPISSSRVRGMGYLDVVAEFQNAGFEDVRPEGLRDLGFLRRLLFSSEGRTVSVYIADRREYDTNCIFRKSDIVRIRYHSAKEPLLMRLLSVLR